MVSSSSINEYTNALREKNENAKIRIIFLVSIGLFSWFLIRQLIMF